MITVLMGAPAAGKTTWVKKNMSGVEHIYSTELVRIDRELDVDYYMASIRAAAIKACKSGQDVIADGTHTITHHRTFWLRLANRFDCNTKLIVFDTPLSILLQGNNARVHPCPNHVLLKHHKRMQMAKRMMVREAWDEIETVVRNV
jgi:predicted kinase